ncbi:MAG: hypothetical protein ACAF42_18965 [Limnothrix sp. BL-A-16]
MLQDRTFKSCLAGRSGWGWWRGMQPVTDAANKRPQSNRHDPAKPVTIVARVAKGDRAVLRWCLGSRGDRAAPELKTSYKPLYIS